MRFVKTLAMLSVFALVGAGCSSLDVSRNLSEIETPSGEVIDVMIALSETDHNKGLSGMSDIGDGMVFCFSEHKIQKFWMLGMQVDIDMIWIDGDTVTGVADNVPVQTNNQWTRRESRDQVNTVLEVPAGMAAELGIKRGSKLTDVSAICS